MAMQSVGTKAVPTLRVWRMRCAYPPYEGSNVKNIFQALRYLHRS
ncbi:hypothetical protein [Aquaspirillum serpens]|nr:hypothetical protein [Aquaspirillum serpens]